MKRKRVSLKYTDILILLKDYYRLPKALIILPIYGTLLSKSFNLIRSLKTLVTLKPIPSLRKSALGSYIISTTRSIFIARTLQSGH